jgi:hypothetical protein
MRWTIEYYEQADTTQPVEVFEDAVYTGYPKLAGKLALRWRWSPMVRALVAD